MNVSLQKEFLKVNAKTLLRNLTVKTLSTLSNWKHYPIWFDVVSKWSNSWNLGQLNQTEFQRLCVRAQRLLWSITLENAKPQNIQKIWKKYKCLWTKKQLAMEKERQNEGGRMKTDLEELQKLEELQCPRSRSVSSHRKFPASWPQSAWTPGPNLHKKEVSHVRFWEKTFIPFGASRYPSWWLFSHATGQPFDRARTD